MLKVCRDCKFYKPNNEHISNIKFSKGFCTHPKSTTIDLITGDISYNLAMENRLLPSMCGEEGMLYEREDNVLRKVIRELSGINGTDIVYIVVCFVIIILIGKSP